MFRNCKYLFKVDRLEICPILSNVLKNNRHFSNTSVNYANQHQGKPDWNRAVSDAEKIVGYPTSYLTLRSLLSDEMSNMAVHLRKLVGSSHPLLKTAKRLIYDGRNNMQTRGLIVLLISKAAGHLKPELLSQDLPEGVSHSQRTLAEITEMIHTAHLIHKGVVNLSPSIYPDGTTLEDMTYGNKLAILSGDYLLANACTGLASLNNTRVVELVSGAISDSMEAEFFGNHDSQERTLLSLDFSVEDWEHKNFLAAGSLLAKSCQAAVLLAEHDEEKQKKAFDFGKNIALAWQIHNDLQPFVDTQRHPPGTPFNLSSAPVVLHVAAAQGKSMGIPEEKEDLKFDAKNLDELANIAGKSIDEYDFDELYEIISSGPGLNGAKRLCRKYTDDALSLLGEFGSTDARTALENIVRALRED